MIVTGKFRARPIGLALIAGVLFAASPASSQNGLDNLSSVATMNGACERLVVRGADITSQCQGHVINSAHTDGRSGFAFFQAGSAVISFAGQDSAAVGDRATLHVDMVLIAAADSAQVPKPEVIPASGACEYTNPYAGVSTVTCTATTSQGEFRALFRSDGREPDVQRIQH
jgi:hypothetical protein